MTEVKEVGRRRTQLLDNLRNRRRYWKLKEEAENRKKVETTVYQSNTSIFHKSLDLLISSILNNNNWMNLYILNKNLFCCSSVSFGEKSYFSPTYKIFNFNLSNLL